MTIMPTELRERPTSVDETDPAFERLAEAYEDVRRERDDLREELAELRASRRAPVSPVKTRSKGRRVLAHAAFGILSICAIASMAATVAVVGGIYELDAPGGEGTLVPAPRGTELPAPARTAPPPAADVAQPEPVEPAAAAAPELLTLRLTARRGESWLEVRNGSREGKVLYEGVLAPRQSVSFRARRFFVRLGAPAHIDAHLNGTPLERLSPTTGDVVIDADGPRVVSLG